MIIIFEEAIHIKRHPNNMNSLDSEVEIPEAWMPTIKQHNRLPIGWTAVDIHCTCSYEGTVSKNPPTQTTTVRIEMHVNQKQPQLVLQLVMHN